MERNRRAAWVLILALVPAFVCLVGCSCQKDGAPARPPGTAGPTETSVGGSAPVPGDAAAAPANAREAFPWLKEGKDLTGKPLERSAAAQVPNQQFLVNYSKGLSLLEDEKFDQALQVFEEIVKTMPGSDEASMAQYRVAQALFRKKNNAASLEAYKVIVEQYPRSPVAENARAAIQYLTSFEKHEKTYVSPEVEAQKRR